MPILIEKRGRVWTVIHDRVEARNAMDPESAQALCDALLAFDRDPGAHVAVLWGAGGSFCAGWDLKYAASLQTEEAFRSGIRSLDFPNGSAPAPRGPLGPTRLELSKPVIAAVEGPAVAGGMELAMWCDVRIMGEGAYFGVYCRRWGIPLMDGGAVRLPRLVGQGRALELILTGRQVPAEEAVRIGLCERVVARGEARLAAERMAEEIARFPQLAVRADRRTAYESHGLSVRDAMKREWWNGLDATREGTVGAARFAAGRGRHGDFRDI
jgi:enoyl-CoA hydratase